MPEDTLLRSAVWLLIYWTKYYTSEFVIVLTIRLNYALDYTPDRVLQVSVKRLLLLVKAKFHYAVQLASSLAGRRSVCDQIPLRYPACDQLASRSAASLRELVRELLASWIA